MSAAEYHNRLRHAEMERQRREILLRAGDGRERTQMPKTLIGPGIHPSMFPERRSSTGSVVAGVQPFEDDSHAGAGLSHHPGNTFGSRHFASPFGGPLGDGGTSQIPSPSTGGDDSRSTADSPNPDLFASVPISSGFAMAYDDIPGLAAAHAHAHGPPLHTQQHEQHPFVNFTRDAYHFQHHHPLLHPQYRNSHSNLGPAFQPSASASASAHQASIPLVPLEMQLQYPGDGDAGENNNGNDNGNGNDSRLELDTNFAALLNSIPPPHFRSSALEFSEVSAQGSAHAHAHGLGGINGHGGGGDGEMGMHVQELSLPHNIAAPRPVPYATYLHNNTPSLSHSQLQPQHQPHRPQSQSQHGQYGEPEFELELASNASVAQWDNRDHGAVPAVPGPERGEGLGDVFGGGGGGISQQPHDDVDVDVDGLGFPAAATNMGLQARFEAMAAAGVVGMPMDVMSELFYHHHHHHHGHNGALSTLRLYVHDLLMDL